MSSSSIFTYFIVVQILSYDYIHSTQMCTIANNAAITICVHHESVCIHLN